MNKEPDAINKIFENRIKIGYSGQKYDVLGGGALMPTEARQLFKLVEKHKPNKCVEVGTGFGASAVAICAALRKNREGHLWSLNPFQNQHFENIGCAELQRLGLKEFCTFLEKFAEDFFYEQFSGGPSFDLIFQDGAHNIGMKMTHTFLGNKLLKPGGLFVFHDAFKPCASACITYLGRDCGYKVIPLMPDSHLKRLYRVVKHGFRRGIWFGMNAAPCTHLNLVTLKKP